VLWRYTRGLLGFNVVNYWSRNMDNLLVGSFLGVTSLGYYSRAYSLMNIPVGQIRSVLYSVFLATLSRLQDDRERLASMWIIGNKASFLVAAPLAVSIATSAPALVETAFGAHWSQMAPVLALLAASIPAHILMLNSGALFQTFEATGRQFRWGVVFGVGSILGIVAGLPFGIVGVAAGLTIGNWVAIWFFVVPAMRLASIRLRDVLRSLGFIALASVAMAGAAIVPRLALAQSPAPLVLILQLAVGMTVYAVFILSGERQFLAVLKGRRRSP
jgi:PST family polysaccharide transporter